MKKRSTMELGAAQARQLGVAVACLFLGSVAVGCAVDDEPPVDENAEVVTVAAFTASRGSGNGTPTGTGTGGLLGTVGQVAPGQTPVATKVSQATLATVGKGGSSTSTASATDPSAANPGATTEPTAPAATDPSTAIDPNAPPATDPTDGTSPNPPSYPLCTPGTHLCTGRTLLVCGAAGDQWLSQTTCAYDGLCDAANARCMTCVPGSTMCVGFSIPLSSATTEMATCQPDGMGYGGSTFCALSCAGGHCQ